MERKVEELAHILYLADLEYDGSGDKYTHMARAILRYQEDKIPEKAE